MNTLLFTYALIQIFIQVNCLGNWRLKKISKIEKRKKQGNGKFIFFNYSSPLRENNFPWPVSSEPESDWIALKGIERRQSGTHFAPP